MIDQFKSYHVLVFKDEEVLLVRHGNQASHFAGVYGIPGGRSRENEIEKETALRELNEETGLVAKINDLTDFKDNLYTAYIKRKVGPSGNFTMKVFTTNQFSGQLKTSGETVPEWIKISKLDKYNLLPNVKNAVLAAKKVFAKA